MSNLLNINTNTTESTMNNMETIYIQNLTAGFIHEQGIDGTANNLIFVFGNGYEKDNLSAIKNWIIKTIEEKPSCQDNPLQFLNQCFKIKIDAIIDNTSCD